MNILIDTHIFLYLANGDLDKLHKKHLKILEDIHNKIYLSTLSIAEISIKTSINKLKFEGDILWVLEDMSIEVLEFDAKSAVLLRDLPFHHKDPFDRMIIAQAITNKLKILTYDEKFKFYKCKII